MFKISNLNCVPLMKDSVLLFSLYWPFSNYIALNLSLWLRLMIGGWHPPFTFHLEYLLQETVLEDLVYHYLQIIIPSFKATPHKIKRQPLSNQTNKLHAIYGGHRGRTQKTKTRKRSASASPVGRRRRKTPSVQDRVRNNKEQSL